jgi:NET1-associated nuclear protein 1 (U3 small nucleolar RNA-associated protein 17)
MPRRFLLVANRTTIHIYSTSTSLLTRSIKPQIDFTTRRNARIITYCLSPTDPELVWVACSDGAIYCINWTSGAGADQYWSISSTGCIHMTVASMESAGRRRDVVFTTEVKKDGDWRITANELAPPGGAIQTGARTIYTSTHKVNFLTTANEGSVIVAASGNRVLLGVLRNTEYDSIDKIRYEFRVFESADFISSLDIKVSARPGMENKKSKKRLPIVDVVVGDVKGAIFIHDDLWANLVGELGAPSVSILPRKLHWHRQGVHTVKYSSDGMYAPQLRYTANVI